MARSEWSRRAVGEFARRVKRINSVGEDLPPLSVTKDRGVMLQSDKYKKRIATDGRKYQVAYRGEFVFDPMSLYYGAIGRQEAADRGLISPDYVAFEVDHTVDHSFLDYLLRWPGQHPLYESKAETGNQFGKRRRLYWSVMETLAFDMPPLNEQRRIAAILSTMDDLIEKTEAIIAQLQVVKKAMMQELLTRGLPGRHTRFKMTEIGEMPESWEFVRLAGLATAVTSGSRGWAQYYSDEGAVFLRITNLARGTIHLDLSDLQHVALPVGSGEGTRTRVRPGDVLFSITAELGLVGCVPQSWAREAYVNQHVALARLDGARCSSEYVATFFASTSGQRQFLKLNDGGAKAGLNLNSIRTLLLPLPTREEQEGIARAVEIVECRIEAESAALGQLQSVKAALASALLTGDVRVDVDQEVAA